MPHSHNIIDKDNHFIINPVTRKIQPETHEKNKLVEGDHNSEKYTFEVPKLIEGHDMSRCNIVQIHYLNVSSDKTKKVEDVYEVDDLGVLENKDDTLAFTWTIKETATRYNGLLSFAITFKCTTNDTVDYAWHTEIYTGITIGKGMNNGLIIISEYSDILEKWKEELFAVDGRIETAARKALTDIENAKNTSLSSIAQHGTVQVSNEEPTDPNVDLYINPDETVTFSVPEINDNAVSDEDTWSSAKIDKEFQSVNKKYIEVDADEVVDGALINLDNKDLHNLHPNCYIKQIIPGNIKSIKVSGKSASAQWGFSLCGCYKEDGSLISKFGNDDNTVYTDLLIEIPNECAYVYINQAGNSSEKYKKIKFFMISNLTTDVENLKTNVSNLTTDMSNLKKKINVDLNFNKIGYIEPNPEEPFYVVSNGNGFRTDYIPTEGYKKIKYDLKGDIRYIYLIAFFDENKKFLRDETQSIITKNADTISIPENAKYVVASTYSSSVVNGTASLINNNSLDEKITKLDSRITKIESIGIYGDSEFALFKKFGIVGDSLSVGHTVSKDGQTALGRNIYWSWGQYMARRLGNICLNFGRSGVTSKLWLNPSEQYCYPRLIDKANLCQAYIVALGANDTQAPLGSISDVNFTDMSLNADTEYGNYAKIIDTIQKTAPKAPIFLCTIPHPRNSDINIQAINNMIREFASESRFTGVYLVDLDAEYNEYYKTGKLGDEIRNTGWHLTSLGYLYDSFVRQRALSQVVADNCAEFQDVFLLPVGTNNELD